jgi:hypothetical protein
MIVEMVASLEKRLAKSGGASSDWAQLIFSQAVLGNDTAAKKTFQEAIILFMGQESDLKILRQAAVSAGIIQ